jgi:hypothetical protein
LGPQAAKGRTHEDPRPPGAGGDDFRRYTYGDVFEQPELMLAELHGLLPRDN